MITAKFVLGVDPGGAHTGLCVRNGNRAMGHLVLDRGGDETQGWERGIGTGPVYVGQVLASVAVLVDTMQKVHGAPPAIAVEAVVAPSPHMRRGDGRSWTNPTGALGAAVVLGAVLAAYPDVIVVPPAQHGMKPLAAYPEELVGRAELRLGLNHVGTGRLRHARAAFDIAGVARWWAVADTWAVIKATGP